MNAIDVRLNLQLLQQDIEAAGVLVKEFFDTLKAYEGTKISPINLTGLAELTAAIQAQNTQMEKLSSQVTNLTTITKSYAQSTSNLSALQQKAAASASDQAKQEAILRVQIQENTRANVDAARQMNPLYQQRMANAKKEQDELDALRTKRKLDAQSQAEQNRVRKQEIKDIELEGNEYKKLKIAVNDAEVRYVNFRKTLGETAIETKAAYRELGVLSRELNKLEVSLQGASKSGLEGFSRQLTGGLSLLRTAAYILPGIGIAGIFNLIYEGIEKVLSELDLFDNSFVEVNRKFSDGTEKSRLMRDSLNELGTTADSVADGAAKNLTDEIKRLNDELGNTPDIIQQTQASMGLLQDKIDGLEAEIRGLSQASEVYVLSMESFGEEQQILQNEVIESTDKVKKLRLELEDLRRLQRDKANQEDLKAQGEANKLFLEHEIDLRKDAAKRISDDSKASFKDRFAAVKNQYQAQLDLNKQFLIEEQAEAFDNEGKKEIAREKFRYANLKAEQEYQDDLRRLMEEQAKKSSAAAQKALEDLMNKVRNQYRFLTEFNQLVSEQGLARLQTIAQDSNALGGVRIIALKLYLNQQRAAWEQASKDEAKFAGEGSAESLAIRQKYLNMILKLEADIAKQIADINRKEAADEEKAREDAIARFEEMIGQQGDESSAHLRANRKQREDYAKEVLDLQKRVRDAEKQLAREAFDLVGTLIQARYDAEEERIRHQIELMDEMYAHEQDAIEKSTLSSKDKAAYEMQLSQQKEAADKKAAQQERKLKHDAAVIQKQVDAGQVVAQTAIAVVSALKLLPPFDLILAGLYAGIGAVQLAKIEATHIPAYEHGGTTKEDTVARVGERNKPELVKEPGRSPYWVMKETVKFFPKGTEIIPMYKVPVINIGREDDSWEQTRYIARAISTTAKKEIRNVFKPNIVIDLGFEGYKNKVIYGG